jgi:hypothetical protein
VRIIQLVSFSQLGFPKPTIPRDICPSSPTVGKYNGVSVAEEVKEPEPPIHLIESQLIESGRVVEFEKS